MTCSISSATHASNSTLPRSLAAEQPGDRAARGTGRAPCRAWPPGTRIEVLRPGPNRDIRPVPRPRSVRPANPAAPGPGRPSRRICGFRAGQLRPPLSKLGNSSGEFLVLFEKSVQGGSVACVGGHWCVSRGLQIGGLGSQGLEGRSEHSLFHKLCSPIGIPEWHRPRTEPCARRLRQLFAL